jgi:hypothetical protein
VPPAGKLSIPRKYAPLSSSASLLPYSFLLIPCGLAWKNGIPKKPLTSANSLRGKELQNNLRRKITKTAHEKQRKTHVNSEETATFDQRL